MSNGVRTEGHHAIVRNRDLMNKGLRLSFWPIMPIIPLVLLETET